MANTEKGIYYPSNYDEIADIPSDMKKMAESADEAIGNSMYDDTEIKKDISSIKEKNKLQDTEIANIKKEQTTQNTTIQKNTDDIATANEEINKVKETDISQIKQEQTTQNEAIQENANNIASANTAIGALRTEKDAEITELREKYNDVKKQLPERTSFRRICALEGLQ